MFCMRLQTSSTSGKRKIRPVTARDTIPAILNVSKCCHADHLLGLRVTALTLGHPQGLSWGGRGERTLFRSWKTKFVTGEAGSSGTACCQASRTCVDVRSASLGQNLLTRGVGLKSTVSRSVGAANAMS
eukprot:6204043-Pleurochrysis_carterae.AAC.1